MASSSLTSPAPAIAGFIGLDELRLEMAASLVAKGFQVQGFEVCESDLMKGFLELGGKKCGSAMEAAKDAMFVFILTSSEAEHHSIVLGEKGVTKGLQKDAIVIIQSILLPYHIQALQKNIKDETGNVNFIDAYIFRGVSEDMKSKIIVVASGEKMAIQRAQPVLSAICEKIFLFDGDVGSSSKARIVNNLLEGIHYVAAVEAMFLGVRAGVHPAILYDIISNAAGSSWIFVDIVPKLLNSGCSLTRSLEILVKNVSHAMDMAKSVTFPLPLLAIAYQQLVQAFSGNTRDDVSAGPLKIWEQIFGVNIREAAEQKSYSPGQLADQLVTSSKSVTRIGFIGLGAMGFGMATHLLKSNFSVSGYDVYKPSLARFADAGGKIGNSPEEISRDVEVLIIMVANEAQAESVLYGDFGAVSALPAGATIIVSSTVSPGFIVRLEQRLKDKNKGLKLVDAPVSGGVVRAAEGTLTIMAAGSDEALPSAGSVLSALSEKLYIIQGGCGAASSVKMVNQLLAGVHIAAAAEAIAFGARLGLNTRKLFEVINHAGGYSWMFGNRVPHMLDSDYKPYSAIDIFVKDLGIVSNESSNLKIPLHISSTAHQLFLSGSASGWGRYDDAAVVKVYETLTGVKVEGKVPFPQKEGVLSSLPPEWPENPMDCLDLTEHQNVSKVLVVLDDDPTGTQTVHDIDVLTEWKTGTLIELLNKRPACFFILTNSRSLPTEKAIVLIKEICSNVAAAAEVVKDIECTIVLRGDSTLRGHFPEEADAAVSVLGEMDAWIICPFFLEGGRYTIDDIHYVVEADKLIPAGETEFSKDATFGYKSSNLREWVEEKSKGRIPASSVSSVSIDLLRRGGPVAVCEHLCSLQKGSACIVNAASEKDVAVFAAGMIMAERKGKHFLCRTAASFVSARLGIKSKPPISPSDIGITKSKSGGLIVVGSYVPKTTKQVEELRRQFQDLKYIEVSVDKIAMRSTVEREEEINNVAEIVNASLKACKDTLVLTSRQLITGKSPEESLEINCKVSTALVDIVRKVNIQPRYIIAKGGITSSDIATKALEAKCARVIGQALPGVPLWLLGSDSKHPGVPYIVFPGNVGDSNALAEVVRRWRCLPRSSTKDILYNAEKGGYAVGAFNIYNLEGAQAVIAAAEIENSPAILQIHPGALNQGGAPLVACCISAAEKASVPVAVHYDHGTSKNEILEALEMGFDSVMVDGSHLPYEENILYTNYITQISHAKGLLVEAELGRLSGTEDGLTVKDYEARLTDAKQAHDFISRTGIDALAVCIGNVHGKYPPGGPNLKLDLLKDLRTVTAEKGVTLVLHGASGLPKDLIKECINLGVRKFNVNTEIRAAYMDTLQKPHKDLVDLLSSAKEAMQAVIAEKMRLFGSAGKAC